MGCSTKLMGPELSMLQLVLSRQGSAMYFVKLLFFFFSLLALFRVILHVISLIIYMYLGGV